MSIKSKPSTDAYGSGWDRIFGKKPEPKPKVPQPVVITEPQTDPALDERKAADALRLQWYSYLEANQHAVSLTFQQWFDQIHSKS